MKKYFHAKWVAIVNNLLLFLLHFVSAHRNKTRVCASPVAVTKRTGITVTRTKPPSHNLHIYLSARWKTKIRSSSQTVKAAVYER